MRSTSLAPAGFWFCRHWFSYVLLTGWAVGVATAAFLVRLFPDGQPLAIRLLVGCVVGSRADLRCVGSVVASLVRPSRRGPDVPAVLGLVGSEAVGAPGSGVRSVGAPGATPTVLDQILDAFARRPASSAQCKEWVHPRLCSATARGVTLTLTVRARTGQTVDDLERAAPALAAAASARAFRFRALSPSTAELVLVMADRLDVTRDAVAPVHLELATVPVGRRQDGTPWLLPVIGRHTLVVGCSGLGQGLDLLGRLRWPRPRRLDGLGPVVGRRPETWGRGRDGRRSVQRRRHHPTEAVAVLTRLLGVVDERGRRMAGTPDCTARPGRTPCMCSRSTSSRS